MENKNTISTNPIKIAMDIPECAEAHITGVTLAESTRELSISLRGRAMQPMTLVAHGVERLLVSELREQNIIDRVIVWDVQCAPADYRELLGVLLSGASRGKIDPAFFPVIESEIASIVRGEKILVEIEPVYGASVIFLAQAVKLC